MAAIKAIKLWLLLSSVTLATNLADFNMFAKHWLVPDCGWCRGYDYSGDGDVDLVDLVVFAERWLAVNKLVVTGLEAPFDVLNGDYVETGTFGGQPLYVLSENVASIGWSGTAWALADNESPAHYWLGSSDVNTVAGNYSAVVDTEAAGTAIVQFTGARVMPHFNYRKVGSGADRSFRIDNPRTSQVWKDGVGLVDSSSIPGTNSQAETSVAITFDVGLRGYPITIPATLPAGDYDILFFNVAKAAAAAADEPEAGYGFKWNGKFLSAPLEVLIDRIG